MKRKIYDQFYVLLRNRVGISLDEKKDYLIESRLKPVACKYEFDSVEVLVEHLLKNSVGQCHWESFVALTTNETQFFRDPHVFDGIRDYVLPKLIESRREEKVLNIWSAAASTGQEAYSIAILIRESFPELASWKINIVATDISSESIARAKVGIYTSRETERGLDVRYRNRYFIPRGDSHFEISEDVRCMVSFSTVNLVSSWPRPLKFDLILLRNVLIYFDQPIKNRILDQVHITLAAGAYLVLGASEYIHANSKFCLNQNGKFSCYSQKR